MKKCISFLLAVILAFSLFSLSTFAQKSNDFAIVISSTAKDTEKYAAEVLSEYAGKIAGGKIETFTNAKDVLGGAYIFYVGGKGDLNDKPVGSYVINPTRSFVPNLLT